MGKSIRNAPAHEKPELDAPPYAEGYRPEQAVLVVSGEHRGETLRVVRNVGIRSLSGEVGENWVELSDGEWLYQMPESRIRPKYAAALPTERPHEN